MPELPEVETVCRELEQKLYHHRIVKVIVRERRLRSFINLDFESNLENQTLISFKRRAKYIQIGFLETPLFLILHLGMSGRIGIFSSPSSRQKHDHVIFNFQSGYQLKFCDPRRFGMMKLTSTPELLFQNLGLEPLSDQFTASYLIKTLTHRNVSIKSALLNQKFVVGLGNIYICEALYLAGIHPARSVKTITINEYEKLVLFIKIILQKAIQAGGSTLKDHKRTDGSSGLFQFHFNVYDQKGNLCQNCKKSLINRFKQANRSSYFCPICQPLF